MGKIEKVGKNLKVKSFAFFVVLSIISVFSCEIGLGAAVDVAAPTSGISYPPQNAVVRDTFVAAGICEDDMEVISVKVTVTNTEDNSTYGPYDATLAEDKKSWTINLNNKDPSKSTSVFDSYRQWEIPDGNYVISAVAYDDAEKESPAATLPISIDNTAPVLIVSKPLAKGSNVAPTIYGSSLKISGDIAEDHETSKMLISLREFDDSTGAFTSGSTVQTIEITDTAELNAMSSSNPLIIAKFDRSNTTSQQHQNYVRLYGNSENGPDKYYYCGFLLEDNALVYQNPADSGSGTGNQTECYYLLTENDFQKNLAVNYSLTAQRLMQIFKGKSEDYNATQINEIAAILTKTENNSSSTNISTDSSKFSLNPHNNPSWSLDEYAVDNGTVKSYTAGSSLILSLTAGRDGSYPDPKTVSVYLYDITTSTGDVIANYSTEGITPIPLIQKRETDNAGNVIKEAGKIAEIWDESADDSNKTYTFTLDTESCNLNSGHYYKMDVKGTDRNKIDLEPSREKNYVLRLSTSNNIPKVTITEPIGDKTFGTASAYGNVNTDGVTVKGYIITDGVGLHGTTPLSVKILRSDVNNGSSPDVTSAYNVLPITITPATDSSNKYLFEVTIKSNTFVPATESKYLYTVTVTAKDASDLEGEKQVKFYVDNKKPEVKINPVSPVVKDGSNEYVNGTITVSGTASDSGNTGSGLQSVSYTINDGDPVTIASATAGQSIPESWSFKLPTKNLTDNQDYTIKVYAIDTVGNENVYTTTGSVARTFSLKQSTDTPVLSFSNADDTVATKDGLKVTTSTGTEIKNMFGATSNNKLYGSITDDDGLGEVILEYKKEETDTTKTKINPTTALAADAKSYSFEYALPFTKAQQGQYQIFVTAKDKYAKAAGTDDSKRETSKDTLAKNFWIIVDEGAPELSDISVTPAAVNDWYKGNKTGSSLEKITVSGKVKDGSGEVTLTRKIVTVATDGTETDVANSSATVELKVNGTTADAIQIANGVNWTDTITLPSTSGKYKVIYSAKDKYNQEESYPIEFSVDVDAPTFSVLNIGSNEINNPSTASSFTPWISDNTVTVEATVGDGTAGSGVKEVSYTLDGTTYKPMMQSTSNDAIWSADVSFDEGSEKTIKLRVKDNVENEKETASFKVNIDKTKPNLEVKWFKISDNTTDGSLETIPQTGVAPTAYVNSKDLVIFGNYDDGENGSGVKALSFKVGNSIYTPSADNLTYFSKAFTTEAAMDGEDCVLEKDSNGKYKNALLYSEANAKNIKSFLVVIDHTAWASATGDVNVTVSGSDQVDATDSNNTIHGVTKTAVTLKKDTGAPLVSGVVINQINGADTKAAYGPVGGKYYIRNTKDGNLKLEGTTTDSDGLVDYTIVTIAGQNGKAYTARTTAGSWTLTEDVDGNPLSLSTWDKNSNENQPDATVTITAYDKAGNSSANNTNVNCVKTLDLYFDEAGPEVLTGKVEGDDKPAGYDLTKVSDKDDTSNPYSSDYTFRGKTAWKYGGIKIGNGKYGETSYGRESSLKISVSFIGEANGSGVQKMEYRLLKASDATAYSNTHTGLYLNSSKEPIDPPTGASQPKEFTLIESKTYNHYGNPTDTADYACHVGTETINGFEPTTDGNPNLLFVRAIDNCGNAGRWFVLLVQMDNEKPTVTSDPTNPESILTNGKSTLPTLTGSFDDGAKGAGLKAARVKIDGNTVIDANFTSASSITTELSIVSKDNADEILLKVTSVKNASNEIELSAKDKDDNSVDLTTDAGKEKLKKAFNNAVEVSFTNDYGTFTYKTKAEADGKRYSFKDASSKADWELTLTPQKTDGTWTDWFNAIKNKTSPQITVEAEDWAEDAASSGNKGTNIVSSLDIDVSNPSVTISSPLNTKTLNGNQEIAGTVTENHTPKTVEIWYSNKNEENAPTAFGTDDTTTAATAFKLLKKITVGDTLADGTKVEEKDIYNFKYTHNFNELLQSDNSGNKIAGKVHILIYTEDKAGNYNINKTRTITSSDYTKYNVDPDSDRPVITVTNRNMVIKGGTDASPTYTPMTSTDYLMLNTNTLNIKLEDDDGIEAAKYRITKNGGTEGAWLDIPSENTISFTDEGKQSLEFYIKDKQGGEYTSNGGTYEGRSTGKIYLKDSATPATRYGAATAGVSGGIRNYTQNPIIYADVDTKIPVIEKPIYAQLLKTATEVKDSWESDLTKLSPGGPDAKFLQLKLKATDDGTGIKTIAEGGVSVSATLNVNGTAQPISQTSVIVGSEADQYILTIPAVYKNAQNEEVEVEKADYIVTITAMDKAGRRATNSITLKVDNKKPVISISSPSSTDNLSGSVNIDGSVTNENAVIEYAISPLAASPSTYTDETAFSFKKPESATPNTAIALPTTDSSDAVITPWNPETYDSASKYLKALCSYKTLSNTSMMAFNFQLDGKPEDGENHLDTLNQWLKNIGITTDNDIRSGLFNDIVQLYFHIRATDAAGNVNELSYPIRVDPLGTRPTVSIGYPTVEKAGMNTEGLVLGGKPTIIGTATGLNTVDYIWLQVDTDSDGDWDAQDFKVLREKGYKVGSMKTKLLRNTNLDSSDNASEYAIKVNETALTGMSWSQQINLYGELEPAAGTQKNVTVWAYATDELSYISSPEARKLKMDSDTPIIEQDIKLVQWNENFDGSNGFEFENGNIKLTTNAAKAVRTYKEKENVKGKWFIIGKVKDESGLSNITFKVNDEERVQAITITEKDLTTLGETTVYSTHLKGKYEDSTTGTYILPVKETNTLDEEVYNYLFCLPIGNATDDAGTYKINFEATEKADTGTPRSVPADFEVLFDNKAPEVSVKLSGKDLDTADADGNKLGTQAKPLDIYNSNGKYTFGGKATEEKVGSVSQTGVERIAFYFTRNISGQTEQIFDVMIHDGTDANGQTIDLGNHRSYASASGLVSQDGLYWQSVSGVSVSNATLTLPANTDLKNIHTGGLAKVNGVIYRINGVSSNSISISLSGEPGDTAENTTTSALFAIANVVDNPTRESEGSDSAASSGYGYGYYNDGGKDGDLMVESLISTDNINYTWEANVNTKNISDGPVTLHYVVFDKAGNASDEKKIECFVKNNAPRLAGVTLGTDTDGNGEVDNTESYSEFVTEFAGLYTNGYSGKTKMTSLTVPTTSTTASPLSVFKIKGKTIIKPEIVGGNGALTYSYKVSQRNAENTDWENAYKTVTSNSFTLGTGTKDTDTLVKVNNKLPEIVIDVKDFLANGITDGANQKFEFVIEDKTPGYDNNAGAATTAAQTASLNIIMSMDLNDTTPAKNKVIPFYWKSADKNSLKDNDKNKGHIELSNDWDVVTGGTGDIAKVWGDKDPKVSGAFKLEGVAQDNVLLSKLYVNFDNVKLDGTNTKTLLAEYKFNNTTKKWAWDEKSGTGWSVKITTATYEEFIAAGSPGAATKLTEATLPNGKELSDSVSEISQEYGHVVHWILTIDTEAITSLSPKADMVIKVSADDRGRPVLANDNVTVNHTANTFVASSTQSGGESGVLKLDGTDALTSYYKIDLVPYIRGIKTKLSKKSRKTNTSEYDRTALGHYPVSREETIAIYGFNLAKDAVISDSAATAHTLKLKAPENGLYSADGALTAFTSGDITVTVNDIPSLNNKNKNNARGTYGADVDVTALNFGEESTSSTFSNFYNRTPNDTNNYGLTDDVVLDVWYFNSNAALPKGGGRIDEVNMKINPSSKIVGFAFLDSYRYFALPKGTDNSYNGNNDSPANADFRSTATLAYDWRGWSYATDAGGNEQDRIKLWVVDTDGTEQADVSFEFTDQNNNRDGSGNNGRIDLRYKVRSPSIATSKGDAANTTNIYLAYYDSFNDEIRYRAGNSAANNRKLLVNGSSNAAYSCNNAQVIATDTSKNLPSNVSYRTNTGGAVLGGAGEFVSIDVISKGTKNKAGTEINSASDIVVIVWYDAKEKSLKYSYNTNPLDTSWQTGGTDRFRGLNRKNWKDAKTIFTGAGEYCQVKVDQYGGIHIAGFDPTYGDLKYAYLSSYNYADNNTVTSYTVDSNGNTGSHLTLDVAYDKAPTNNAATSGKPIPYITYWGSGMPKIAHPITSCESAGSVSDMFTGNWEVSYIPTKSTISDLDQKKLNNLDNRINVALWKYDANGLITTIQKSKTGTDATAGENTGKCYGNGTAYPVVGYSIMANLASGASDSTNDRIETAQMQ